MNFIETIKYYISIISKKIRDFFSYISKSGKKVDIDNEDFSIEISDIENQLNLKKSQEIKQEIKIESPEVVEKIKINEVVKDEYLMYKILPSMIKDLLFSIENKEDLKDTITEMTIISKEADKLYVDGNEV